MKKKQHFHNLLGLARFLFMVLAFNFAFSGTTFAGVILYGTSTGYGTGEAGGPGLGGCCGPGTGPANFSQFHRVDINTGVATEISGDIGFGGDVGGLAANSDNVLFAGSGGRGPNTLGRIEDQSLLFTIDPFTGLGNTPVIGPLGIEFGPGFGSLSADDGDFDQYGSLRQNIAGWSFDPISGDLFGMTGRGSQLFKADTATGAATRIGSACDSSQIGGPGGDCRRGNAIAFDSVGSLFWATDFEIMMLDPDTGLGMGLPTELDFVPFGDPTDPDAGFRVVAMDFHPLTGELYTAVQQRQARDSPPARSTLAILDPELGTFEIIGDVDGTGVKLNGIAFVATVPEPSVLALFAAGILGLGVARRRPGRQ